MIFSVQCAIYFLYGKITALHFYIFANEKMSSQKVHCMNETLVRNQLTFIIFSVPLSRLTYYFSQCGCAYLSFDAIFGLKHKKSIC